jgi:hypothetical protein
MLIFFQVKVQEKRANAYTKQWLVVLSVTFPFIMFFKSLSKDSLEE